ncbi:SH3 domain-containing kinase-binding protein 1-like, partial [Genypterus blacodes]|uniref:SH3 domain-containing kinase-binding protein 1-like n=1 Tax=Genypterus blacodes TaxID=154954 RepID=UPI003F76EEB7
SLPSSLSDCVLLSLCVGADLDLDLVVSSADKLSHPTASRPRVTDRRPRSQIITPASLSTAELLGPPALEERKEKDRVKEEQESVPVRPAEVSVRRGVPSISVSDAKSTLPAKPAFLPPPGSSAHRPASPSSSSSAPSPSPELKPSPLTPPTVDELRNQLRDLRASVELLKSQHSVCMKQLASTLDEEKKIRISLQMEVEHIKKSLSK